MPRKVHGTASGHTILVVDDQEETLSSVRRLLEHEGHRILTADCGERALTLFKENEVHLLLVDYFMPRMTGEQLVREIRTFDPFVQIILQTGYAGEKPPRAMLAELDIQGYHDKSEGPEPLLLWVAVGLKAHRLIHSLRQRERMQAELVASVSHEFRTPLSIISGYGELLRDGSFGALPPTAQPPLTAVEQAARSLNGLVGDFLSYAKLQARTLQVHRQWVVIEEVATELEQLATEQLKGKPVRFCVDRQGAPTACLTDPGKLRTILRNLVTNAAKFTCAGMITLRIASVGATLHFALRDTGPGIRAEDVERIFEPFRQLDGSATRHHGGIGLGLALSRNLAQLLGGTLEVESAPGVGSTFTLALPAQAAISVDAPPPRHTTRIHAAGAPSAAVANAA